MTKKLLSFMVGLTLAVGASATIDFSPDDVLFWTGSGSNEAVVVIAWDDNPSGNFALAWGVRWDGDVVAANMFDSIAAYDPRFSYAISSGFVNYLSYNDGTLVSGSEASYWCYYVNGTFASAYGSQPMADGDLMEVSSSCIFTMSSAQPATPVSTVATEATLASSEVLYWVGTGSHRAVVALNFAQPDTCLAWGLRFSEDSITIADALEALAEADSRLSVSLYQRRMILSAEYAAGNISLSKIDGWDFNVNGQTQEGYLNASRVADGDFVKCGEVSLATQVGQSDDGLVNYYVWTTPVTPVSIPPATADTSSALCTTIYPLPYSIDFSGYTLATNGRPHEASAPLPECWAVFSNGRYTRDTTATASIYYSGIGSATSINNYGCITPNDPFFSLIACQHYDGTYATATQNMLNYGTKKYAVLPALDSPVGQTILTFDHRCTAHSGACLLVGFIEGDTSHFVAVDSIPIDYRVLHHDTVRFAAFAGVIPSDARMAFCWKSIDTAHTGDYPVNYYCGIDNLSVVDDTTTTPDEPVDTADATIAASDILYWVGEGDAEAIFILNPDSLTSLAWGYRFDPDSDPTVADMVAAIDAADPRLAYTISWETFDYMFFYVDHPAKYAFDNFRFKVDGILAATDEDFEDYDIADGSVVAVSTMGAGQWSTPVVPATVAVMPTDATLSASEVRYWVGSGSNEAVVAINWAVPDTALAWGLRFDGSLNVREALNAVVAADARLTSDAALSTFTYSEGATLLQFQSIPGNYMQYILNGNSSAGPTSLVSDGAFLKVGESAFGIGFDSTAYAGMWYPSGVHWPTAIHPVNAPDTPDTVENPVDAIIAAADILYWVGEGAHEAILAVNWADTALAWGYRFDADSVLLQTIMNDIQAADPRFAYQPGTWGVDDIYYVENNDTTGLQGAYWHCNLNGTAAARMYDQLMVVDGDLVKWGDPADGTGYDYDSLYSYYQQYAWLRAITPISVPDTVADTTLVPTDAAIAASDILYWVGEGAHKVVLAINWADTALAWGYRFDGESVSIAAVMDDIQAADPRFSYTASGMLQDIVFSDGIDSLHIAPGQYWYSLLNHVGSMGMADVLHDGDFYKWGDLSVAVVTDSTWMEYGEWSYWDYTNVWPYTIHPVSVPDTASDTTLVPVDASIAASDILYWVGTGSQQAIVAVNWAAPDTCLAWGVRWNGTATLKDLMDSLEAADPRFSYTASGSLLSDILFATGTDTLKLTTYSAAEWPNYWSFLVNGSMGMNYFDALEVANGDFVKWGDPNASDTAGLDQWGYPVLVWTTRVRPVSVPDVEPQHGPYCGAVGTEGCEAIPADSPDIVGWAVTCVVERGPQNIAVEGSPLVTYGEDTMAVGEVSMTNNLNVVSLGDGGSAVLTFEHPIANGEGFDFAVYENGFDDHFLELAFVEVSSDGQRFVRFPAVSLTPTDVQTSGIGSTDPTMINNLAGKYRNGWGTPFDLDELRDSAGLDINSITHVRIVDVVGSIDPRYGTRDSRGNLVNDPWPTNSYSSGFDLAGVCVLHQNVTGIDVAETPIEALYPNPTADRINVVVAGQERTPAVLYDLSGRSLAAYTLQPGRNVIDLSAWPAGVYILRMADAVHKIVKR